MLCAESLIGKVSHAEWIIKSRFLLSLAVALAMNG
jgi:hypothetical protein